MCSLPAVVRGEPEPHGLLQRAAPAGVRRGALPAETQVTVPLQGEDLVGTDG